MIPWQSITEWGQRLAVITGIATPIYGGLAYLKLTPVSESYVTEKIELVQRGITAARVDTLETKRVVLGLARNDLVREQQALDGATKTEKNPITSDAFNRRLETIKNEIEQIDRKVQKLDDRIEGMKHDE